MPDQLVVLVAIAGIVLVGLALTSIKLVKDAGRLIGLGLLAFLVVLMLNRNLSRTESTDPGVYSNSPNTAGPNAYSNNPDTSAPFTSSDPFTSNAPFTAPSANPTFNPNPATSPTASTPNPPRRAPTLDSVYQGFSSFVQRVLTGIDDFVYGNPYSVGQQPVEQQPVEQQPAQPLEPALLPSQRYEIRPDGVPSRVSTLVESPGSQAVRSPRPGSTRPVSALW